MSADKDLALARSEAECNLARDRLWASEWSATVQRPYFC